MCHSCDLLKFKQFNYDFHCTTNVKLMLLGFFFQRTFNSIVVCGLFCALCLSAAIQVKIYIRPFNYYIIDLSIVYCI